MITPEPSKLRVLQIILAVSALAAAFLFPWLVLVHDSTTKLTFGLSLPHGKLMLILILASLAVSRIEAIFARRAACFHLAFLIATLVVGLWIPLMRLDVYETGVGYYVFLVIAFVFFPVSAMLSPGGGSEGHL